MTLKKYIFKILDDLPPGQAVDFDLPIYVENGEICVEETENATENSPRIKFTVYAN